MSELTEAQKTCGDVIDRLPCLRCGATRLSNCTVPYWERAQATEIINRTPGLYQSLIDLRGQMERALQDTPA